MKTNGGYLSVGGIVFFSLVMVAIILTPPAQASNGCFKYITFKNESAYLAEAEVSYFVNHRPASQSTGRFPVGQEKKVGVPCEATNVTAKARAVAGNDVLSFGLDTPQDRCFRLKGTTYNPRYESCDPAGTPPMEPSGCYRHITFKNQGGYVVDGSVSYQLNSMYSTLHTGNFPAGQEKRIAVPCSAKSVSINAKAVGGELFMMEREIYYNAEDRCYALKGTSFRTSYERCDPPGTPPAFTINCYKHVTVKNEGAYVAYFKVKSPIKNDRGEFTRVVDSGNFTHGQSRKIAIPCDSPSTLDSFAAGARIIELSTIMDQNRDECFVLKGTVFDASIRLCPVEAPTGPSHTITIRNNGAYAAELTVTFSHDAKRPTKREVIQTRQHGSVTIPVEATNIYIKAKAVGGETILEKNFATAQSLCYEVKGTTLMTRYSGCN